MQSPEMDADNQSPAHDAWSVHDSRKRNELERVDIDYVFGTDYDVFDLEWRAEFDFSGSLFFARNQRPWTPRRDRNNAWWYSPPPPPRQYFAWRYAALRYSAHWKLHNIESELCKGDTLIFVDFPLVSAGEPKNDCFGHEWSSVQFRVSSHKLLATGSSKFADMLGANYQSRIQRKRNLLNKLPQGIRFVLDLTPPSEGENLISQVREVALTPGIIGWWTASEKHGVDGRVAFGHDDVCTCIEELVNYDKEIPEDSSDENSSDGDADLNLEEEDYWLGLHRPDNLSLLSHTQHEVQPYLLHQTKRERQSSVKQTAGPVPAYRKIPDYCPVRHRVGILRLMLIIENRPVMVDSAPLAWTLVAVANIFGCAGVVRDGFKEWLESSNKTVFVEALPEESLQLGFTFRLDDVARSAFRILVNELALEQAAVTDNQDIQKIAPYTVFDRKRHNPGDQLNELIRHAAYAMLQRVSQMSERLMSQTIFADLRIPEWELLQSLLQTSKGRPEDAAFRELENVAQRFLGTLNISTGYIADAALEKRLNSGLLTRIDGYRAVYVDTFRPFELIYKEFNIVQKCMCSFVSATLLERLSRITTSFSPMFTDFDADLREKLSKYPDLRREVAIACLSIPEQFGIHGFQDSVRVFLKSFKRDFHPQDFDKPTNRTPQYMLLALTQNEFRFLPPWAGGDNDGTGEVFETSLLPAGHRPEEAYLTDSMVPSDTSGLPECEGGASTQPGSESGHSAISCDVVDSQEIVASTLEPNRITTPTDGQLLSTPEVVILHHDTPSQLDVKPSETYGSSIASSQQGYPRIETSSAASGLLLSSNLAVFGRRIRALLATTGLIEPSIQPNHQRIRWKNVSSCVPNSSFRHSRESLLIMLRDEGRGFMTTM
ncbi:hypothetical protein CH63R_13157 [Colletotrichum higginsianum IMI 349063]|uniref:Uncharacterized protein n=1 Tax=Colletotrichum higginsianum (strain IMI 349063) TaxID=759273 RepID=A0A1B7XWB8_COLHI|nr:hypothetical protein CH63R_13157 [Colletotrichum higginsianum IMI 349063]OBR04030.1 hypothetical protein CH63R_13157 [Colletotrichum higginsianum IMI 349063]